MYKPFTSIDEQVRLLASRGVITDRDTPLLLAREGYYSVVNGYKDPFLDQEQTRIVGDDRYIPGTTFKDLHALFLFDRDLRFLCFRTLTTAEALLRTARAYCFTQSHPDEPNAYLNPHNLDERNANPRDLEYVLNELGRIVEHSRRSPGHGGKAYLYHCAMQHDGEIPLWVLVNDMTMGQLTSLFRVMTQEDRASVARYFEGLYGASHSGEVQIPPRKLDTIYRRIKDFRNICAHDDRLYCAKPYNLNNSFFQLVQDLRIVTVKQRYLEFLQQTESLMMRVKKEIPSQAAAIISAMGVNGLGEFRDYMDQVRKS